jgi:hypothetical protein
MPNPAFLLCDSDALFQFFIASELKPLQTLKNDYGIHAIIVPEVEVELYSNRKFSHRIEPILKKALARQLLEVFDKAILSRSIAGSGLAAGQAVDAVNLAIQAKGNQYYQHVGRGEAYTHAAAVFLGVPALSNDGTAVRALDQAGLPLPCPVLRAFDLIVICYNDGVMSESECDSFRQKLLSENERVPREFEKSSFAGGVNNFYHRLRCSSEPAVDHKGPSYCKPLYLSRMGGEVESSKGEASAES